MVSSSALKIAALSEYEELPSGDPVRAPAARLRLDGKFLDDAGRRFWVRGVTYGAFRRDANGNEYTDIEQVARDFEQMAALGINSVRVPHTAPPRTVLDIAERFGLRVMVGLSAEQYAGYLLDGRLPSDFEERFRGLVRRCARHPALLCYALGNEIPVAQARWLGQRKIAGYLRRLRDLVKEEDPEGLVTYVNYPSTEYLELPFLDIVAFNIYLEREENFCRYLARLQNLAGDRPLLLTEVGLDSLRNGEEKQAEVLDWQIRSAFDSGAVGAFVFSWTDEWYRGDERVEDWAFGITDRNRRPKLAAMTLRRAFQDVPFRRDAEWPPISVVVCTYNGASTIRDCLEALKNLDYPDFEVIVINDGSNDKTAQVLREYDFRVIEQRNLGLSAARNSGLHAATGDIIAYTDDDACPDRHWLRFLAEAFRQSAHAAIGGPNLPPPGDGPVADVVAHAPGGPIHVLLSDELAEHIPGCNMAFRREALLAIGGFDTRFRTAGDDVDICWRLQGHGLTIGFSAAALVWHHRRNSLRAFWRQQAGYGKAEALLAAKWPEKYNALGHASWAGRLYASGPVLPWLFAHRIYHGMWGLAPFQSLQSRPPSKILSWPLMPEWYLLIAALGGLVLLGLHWTPLLSLALPLFAAAVALPLAEAALRTLAAVRLVRRRRWRDAAWFALLLFVANLMQSIARLCGRLRHGLTPWRAAAPFGMAAPVRARFALWTERWRPPEAHLAALRQFLTSAGVRVIDGGDYERWDFHLPRGAFGGARLLMAVEDHGGGRQYVRAAVWPWLGIPGCITAAALALLAIAAARDDCWEASVPLGMAAGLIVARGLYEAGAAIGTLRAALGRLAKEVEPTVCR